LTARPQPEGVERKAVRHYDGKGFLPAEIGIVREQTLEIILNDRPLADIACLGLYVEELAVGFLRSEGLIAGRDDIRKVERMPGAMTVRLYTREDKPAMHDRRLSIASSGARGTTGGPPAAGKTVLGQVTCSPQEIFSLMDAMVEQARIHALTRGTHCAALADNNGIVVLREDIGRHNCLDMLGGYCLLNGLDGSDKILLRTGRVSSEIIRKVWTLETKLVVSISVPTAAALEMAQGSGITLVGAVREGRMTLYTHGEQIRIT